MAATAEQQRLAEILLDDVRESAFPCAGQLDRLEGLISTREELEDYIDILTQKVQETRYPARHTLDRLQRLFAVLRRLEDESE
jgi:hypothetical protein